MVDTDNIPIVLKAAPVDPTPQVKPLTPISKKWKIFLGILLGLNTIVFLQTAFLYFIYKDTIAFLALAMQSNPITFVIGFVGLLVNIAIIVVYFCFRKRRFQDRVVMPTNKKWKIFFVFLVLFYSLIAGLLILISGGIMLALSVITDSIIASFNIIILLLYFEKHKPRKLFLVVGNIIIYLSLVFLIVGIVLQTLSILSFLTQVK